MFSGIIEFVQPILEIQKLENACRIFIRKPVEFNDIHCGDSIACDGVCLTVEGYDENRIFFVMAAETLKVLNWNMQTLNLYVGKMINLERSLRIGDRLHGHFVTGHVDSLGKVEEAYQDGESFFLKVRIQPNLKPLFWKKGSITINGVSLTVNEIVDDLISVCLIPETIHRTNLGSLKKNDDVNIEPDFLARAVTRSMEMKIT